MTTAEQEITNTGGWYANAPERKDNNNDLPADALALDERTLR